MRCGKSAPLWLSLFGKCARAAALRALPTLLCALLVTGCAAGGLPAATATPAPPMASRDLDRLRGSITLPQGVTAATWTVVPVGVNSGRVPGPTDTRLYAYLSLAPEAWEALGPAQAQQRQDVPLAVAGAVLPAALLARFPQAGGQLQVAGPAYAVQPFESSFYHGAYAVRLDDGLLVCLFTM